MLATIMRVLECERVPLVPICLAWCKKGLGGMLTDAGSYVEGLPMKGRLLTYIRCLMAALVLVMTAWQAPPAPTLAFAQEAELAAQAVSAYEHNPIYNPTAMRDVVVNPDAVYGFSPNPDAGSLSGYASYDWTDPSFVAQARENRAAYLQEFQRIFDLVSTMQSEGASMEEIARAASALRNQIRLESYEGNPDGLATVKARNLEKYGDENGPTPEWLFERYGSWEAVLDNAINSNPGMDACCGFYDDNYEKYLYFGQIPLCTVTFDMAGHGETPAAQSVYAGEVAACPEDPVAEGWVFEGWLEEGASEPWDFSAPVAHDVVLVASWSEDVTAEDPEPAPEVGEQEPGVPDPIDDKPQDDVTGQDAMAPAAVATAPSSSHGRDVLPPTGDVASELEVLQLFLGGIALVALGGIKRR